MRRSSKQKSPLILWRVRLIQVGLTIFLISILGKTLVLQTSQSGDLSRIAAQQKRKVAPIAIFRGEIIDRNGVILAVDTARYDLYLRPAFFKATVDQTLGLVKIIGIKEEKLDAIIRKGSITKLASSLSRAKADSVALLRIPGIDLIPTNYRKYPQGQLASHLLGYVAWDSSGKAGIEQTLESELTSARQSVTSVLTRGDGRPITHFAPFKPVISSSFGNQVELTIDSKLQYRVEQILQRNLNRFRAKRATVIVMIPETGEILAWANAPSYDPNRYSQYSTDLTTNWAVSQIYEPGSTFKILTVATALELGAIKPSFKFMDGGELKIGNRNIRNHDYKPGRIREVGLLELLRFSSNTAAAEIALKIKPQDFHAQLVKMGIGSQTGIEIPGESSGKLKPSKQWQKIDVATTSFGQGAVAVTPIQLTAAINAVANNGEWVQPHLIKSIKTGDSGQSSPAKTRPKRRVISEKVAKEVSNLLASSIRVSLEEDATQIAGNIAGYSVAGKTGTAQKYCPREGRYCVGETMASFIGFFPSDRPKFLILAVVDSPKEAGGWGNTVAGPIFNQVGEAVVKMYPYGVDSSKKSSIFDGFN